MVLQKTPVDSSWHSELFLAWVMKYAKFYRTESPCLDNLFEIPEKYNPSQFLNDLEILWDKECVKKKPSLFSCIFSLTRSNYIKAAFCSNLCNFLNCCSFLSIYFVYMYLENGGSAVEGILIALISSICMIFSFLTLRIGAIPILMLKNQLLFVIIAMVHKKIFKLKLSIANNQDSVNKIIGSISTDLEILNLLPFTVEIWGSLLKLPICIGALLWFIGPIGMIGVTISIVHIPIVIAISIYMISMKGKAEKFTYSRIGMMKNFIESIQILKIFAWENEFLTRINKERHNEISWLKKFDIIRGILQVFTLGGIFLSIFLTIVIYVYSGGSLNLGECLVVINCLFTLQVFLPYVFVIGITIVVITLQTITKMQDVLLLSEHTIQINEDNNIGVIINQESKSELFIEALKIEDNQDNETNLFLEAEESDKNEVIKELSGFNFEINPGELIMIVGKVGSGKSKLLQMLLGETDNLNIDISISKNAAYYSEDPWIMNVSIKDNILIGRKFIPELYSKILKSVCLEDDILHMPNGDETIISDRGNTLSGGQKARLSLARVLYTEAELYLLDDPFSSLDSRILKKIFNRSILGILAGKTRVIVMRNYDYLKYADKIMVIENSQMKFFGNFNEFKDTFIEIDFSEYSSIQKKIIENTDSKLLNYDLNFNPEVNQIYQRSLKISTPYKYFILGFKYNILLALCIIGGFSICLAMLAFYYLAAQYSHSNSSTNSTLFLLLFVFLGYASFFIVIIPVTMRLSKANLHLHNNSAINLSKCSSDYFDKHSCGTLLHYFTKDISNIDGVLIPTMQEFSLTFFLIFGSLIGMMIIQPISAVYISLIFIEFFLLSKYVLSIYNKIKRLDIISRGSLATLAHSALLGLSTIRSLKIQNNVYGLMKNSLLVLYRINITADYFSSLFIDSFAQGIIFVNIINIILIIATNGYFNRELSLIVLSILIGLNTAAQNLSTVVTNFDNTMLSVQNLLDVYETPIEKNYKKNALKIFNITQGKIEFRNLCVDYGDKNALSNISCIIQPRDKIAIIGRTGAGKSTIFKAILRLVNPSSGTILIDNQDYLNFSFKSIRKEISASSQTSIIFYGSIRKNLDPFNYHSNNELIQILKKLNLNNIIQKDLDDETFGIESKLSIGEKQLFCLARILLKKSKIVLIDEATSSIDSNTDKSIQTLIKNELSDCTILTISHRLTTFQDYNQVLIIEHGTIVEFGSIEALNANPNSYFRRYKDNQDQNKLIHSFS